METTVYFSTKWVLSSLGRPTQTWSGPIFSRLLRLERPPGPRCPNSSFGRAPPRNTYSLSGAAEPF
jgi:hypothetical protein